MLFLLSNWFGVKFYPPKKNEDNNDYEQRKNDDYDDGLINQTKQNKKDINA